MKKSVIISANVLFTIANFRKDLILFLRQKDYDVICVADKDSLSDSSEMILRSLGVSFIQVDVNRKGLNPLQDLKYMFNLVKIYKETSPDVVLHFTIKPNIYGTVASKIAGIKSINTINGLGSAIIKDNFLSTVLRFMYKFSLSFSSKVFFQNMDDMNYFIEKKMVNSDDVDIVPGSGVDVEAFKNCASANEKLTFLLASRLIRDKGIYEYIEAIKLLKPEYDNIEFLLAGQFDGDNPTAIKPSEVEEWEGDGLIRFLGKTDDIREFFRLSDVVVLPSYREGLSRILIESASASKPIIATNVPGCKEIVVEDKNGFLAEAKDVLSLKKALEKMIRLDRDKFEDMCKYSKERASKKFDKEIVNKIYFNELSQNKYL